MSIVITSGVIEGKQEVVDSVNRAVLRGIERGLLLTIDEFEPTIAKRTGLLRETFESALRQQINKLGRTGDRRVILWSSIRAAAETMLIYALYHFASKGFYVNPTTPGTYPMRLSRFKPIALRNIRTEIIRAIRNTGLEQIARYGIV